MRLIINFLLSTDDKEGIPNVLKRIDENTQKGTDILKAVQSYADKSKSDEIKLRRIDTVINASLEQFKDKFQKANIQYTLYIQPNLPEIQTKDTFEDLISNIFYNSHFCFIELPDEHPRLIDIKVSLLEDKKTIQIIIQDTGRDIAKTGYSSEPDSLFKERGKLGGVNLYLAYLITHDHNGTLTAASYEKGGTTFTIEVPIKQQITQ
jgi:C4-dicarboxylate-specific signal transduction histidine kinase